MGWIIIYNTSSISPTQFKDRNQLVWIAYSAFRQGAKNICISFNKCKPMEFKIMDDVYQYLMALKGV